METNNIGGRRENDSTGNGFGWIVTFLIVVAIVIAIVSMLKEEESATVFPEGCEPGYLFSTTTGVPCPQE